MPPRKLGIRKAATSGKESNRLVFYFTAAKLELGHRALLADACCSSSRSYTLRSFEEMKGA